MRKILFWISVIAFFGWLPLTVLAVVFDSGKLGIAAFVSLMLANILGSANDSNFPEINENR